MPTRNTSDAYDATDDPTCERCGGRAAVRVTCTAIGRSVAPGRRSSAAFAGLCRDCLATFRADPDRSFGTLFDRSSANAQRCIRVERL
ncbi:hypothetical protein [Haladaptatus salinisoli]|uniref:hypothetical protein n=1 Tax=Haladaptatus salinisoli TaxID=2884876 RepID=UPI001D0AE847|nr:hypothetical protein [Haladaptatus salinisoli]